MTSPQFLRLALRPAPLPSGKIPVIGLKAAACCACLAVALGITGCGSLAAADAPIGTSDQGFLQDAMRQVERSYVAPVKPDRFLAKPFQSKSLLDLVHAVLRA